eukprot:93275-Pleurochrysis_carterae.AAC.1
MATPASAHMLCQPSLPRSTAPSAALQVQRHVQLYLHRHPLRLALARVSPRQGAKDASAVLFSLQSLMNGACGFV